MTPKRPLGASSPRRPRYSAPDPSDVREALLSELLGAGRPLDTRQNRLPFESPTTTRDRRVWYAGDARLLRAPCVAIVGTREVSEEGAARARRLSRELAAHGVVIVSGLARGVDTAALTSAISAGGSVVAVIGTPIDRAYPAENAALQEEIAREHLLISQLAKGSRSFTHHFPERNRLMAAVSDATVIVEAADTSGTLHQAAECVRLGRWLFVVKNVMDDPSLEWPAKFRGHANVKTLTETADILRTLAIP